MKKVVYSFNQLIIAPLLPMYLRADHPLQAVLLGDGVQPYEWEAACCWKGARMLSNASQDK